MQETKQQIFLATNNIIQLCTDLNQNVLTRDKFVEARVDYCLAIVREISRCTLDLDEYVGQLEEAGASGE